MAYILPTKIQAGVTFTCRAKAQQYPAPDWVLSLHMRGPGTVDIEATGEGETHEFKELAAQTAQWKPGFYSYVVRATNGEDVQQVEAANVEVMPDITAADDVRTHARITLEAIEAVIQKRATKDQERYVIEGKNGRRELWRTPMADLLKLRDVYRAEVRREDAAARGKSMWGPAVRVRF